MSYSYKQLPNGRWGIYQELKLLATIGCYQTCQKIVASLSSSLPSDLQIINSSTSNFPTTETGLETSLASKVA
jgi:hypothetical protein